MNKARPIFFYIIFFLFCVAFTTTANGYDNDLWARLIAGMSVVQSGIVLKQDFLSYTPTHTWFDHEWGSGVIFYLTQHLFSSAGLILLQATLVFLIFFIITRIISLRGVKTTTAYNFIFYFFSFHAMRFTFNIPIRCQMFTFLFFTIFLYILELSRNGKNKPLILLPFLMLIWNNLHGGCVSGLGLIGIYALGEFLNKKPFKKYLLTIIPTVLVLPINPWGFEYIKFLLKATTMQRNYVIEWWGLFSNYYMFGFIQFKIFSLIMVLTEIATSVKRISFESLDKTKFLILFMTLILAIQHVKLIPFFAIASTCFIYDDFYTLFNAGVAKIKRFINIPHLALAKEIFVYGIMILFIGMNVNAKAFEPMIKTGAYVNTAAKFPYKEVEFIKINNLRGKIFTSFGMGSFVSYKLYPYNLIFMDGRYEEVYYDYLLQVEKEFYLTKDPEQTFLIQKFTPDLILLEQFSPVYKILKSDKNWKVVFEGQDFGVFVKSKDVKKSYKQPTKDINYYKKTLFDTSISFKGVSKKSS